MDLCPKIWVTVIGDDIGNRNSYSWSEAQATPVLHYFNPLPSENMLNHIHQLHVSQLFHLISLEIRMIRHTSLKITTKLINVN